MKKVLFAATVVKTHIMEFHIPYLQMFQEMGWETAVAAKNDYENPAECVIPYADVYYDVPFARFPLKKNNLRAYRQLKQIIEQGDYDIIHCHTPVGAMLTRLAAMGARKKGTKVIYTAHGFHFFKGAPWQNWILYYPVEKFLSKWTDVLITINQEDYARAKKKFHASRIEYVPGVGIDLKKFQVATEKREERRKEFGIKKDAFVLLSVGELNKNKNHQVVIRALAKLQKENLYYVICGQGPLKEELIQLARQLNVSDKLILAGYRTDVCEFYQAADVFAFPSLREGLSVAMMEAMSSGLPVVCNAIRGNTDLIENEKNGLLVENTPEAVASAIARMMEDPKLREQFAVAAREKIQDFEIEHVKARMKDVYLSEERR